VTGNVFRLFGSVGAVIEMSAWIAAVVLAFLLRKRRPSVFHLTLAAGTLSLLAFVVWWAFVFPVNLQLAAWTPEAFPPDWPRWRAQWEWAHASRAVLLILGFAALALSLLADADRNAPAEMKDACT
jgi:hypothetical protein